MREEKKTKVSFFYFESHNSHRPLKKTRVFMNKYMGVSSKSWTTDYFSLFFVIFLFSTVWLVSSPRFDYSKGMCSRSFNDWPFLIPPTPLILYLLFGLQMKNENFRWMVIFEKKKPRTFSKWNVIKTACSHQLLTKVNRWPFHYWHHVTPSRMQLTMRWGDYYWGSRIIDDDDRIKRRARWPNLKKGRCDVFSIQRSVGGFTPFSVGGMDRTPSRRARIYEHDGWLCVSLSSSRLDEIFFCAISVNQ